MDLLFLQVIPPSSKATVADGAITGLPKFGELQEQLIRRSLEVSQRILVWATVPADV